MKKIFTLIVAIVLSTTFFSFPTQAETIIEVSAGNDYEFPDYGIDPDYPFDSPFYCNCIEESYKYDTDTKTLYIGCSDKDVVCKCKIYHRWNHEIAECSSKDIDIQFGNYNPWDNYDSNDDIFKEAKHIVVEEGVERIILKGTTAAWTNVETIRLPTTLKKIDYVADKYYSANPKLNLTNLKRIKINSTIEKLDFSPFLGSTREAYLDYGCPIKYIVEPDQVAIISYDPNKELESGAHRSGYRISYYYESQSGINITDTKERGIKITWPVNLDIEKYEVFRKADGEKSWKRIGITASSVYYDTYVGFGHKYRYFVRPVGKTTGYTTKEITHKYTPDFSNLTYTVTGDYDYVRVSLSGYDNDEGVTSRISYRRYDAKTKKWSSWTRGWAGYLSYNHYNNISQVAVQMVRKTSDGDYVPLTPYHIESVFPEKYNVLKVAANSGANKVNLAWRTLPVKGYQVIYRVFNQKTQKWGSWKAITTSTQENKLTHKVLPGYIYQYAVRGYNDYDAEGKPTLFGQFTISDTIAALKAPTVKAVPTQNGAKVTWNKVAGANGYRVYYKKAGAKSWTLVSKTTALSYSRNLPKGEIGQFAVYAVYNYKAGGYDRNEYLAISGYVKSYASLII